MSITFDDPPNKDARAAMKAFFGQPVAADEKTFLFDDLPPLEGRQLSKIANKAGQTMTVGLHGEGEIKTLSDGTQYKVTSRGWRKIMLLLLAAVVVVGCSMQPTSVDNQPWPILEPPTDEEWLSYCRSWSGYGGMFLPQACRKRFPSW